MAGRLESGENAKIEVTIENKSKFQANIEDLKIFNLSGKQISIVNKIKSSKDSAT